MSLRTIPRGRRVRGVQYGPAWRPHQEAGRPRPPKRVRGLQHVAPSDRAQLVGALSSYETKMLERSWTPAMRALLDELEPLQRQLVVMRVCRAAAGTALEHVSRLVLVRDERDGGLNLASHWRADA